MTTNSASAYTARAIAVRCFCPPLNVMPFSPISVKSPKGSRATSDPRHALSRASSYLILSKLLPNKTFSFNERDCTHATCATYEVVPFICGEPFSAALPSGPSHPCISPSKADISADLPLPTGPTTTVSWPFFNVKSMFLRNGVVVSGILPSALALLSAVQWKYPPLIEATTDGSVSVSSCLSTSVT